VVQGANDTLGPSGRASIAAEIDQIVESIKAAGNTQYAGRYIFSGSLTTTAPYTPGGPDAYLGNSATIYREIGPGVQVPLNVDGASVIGDGATPGSLLATLKTISADLTSNNGAALQTTDLAAIDAANDDPHHRARSGPGTNRLDTALGSAPAARGIDNPTSLEHRGRRHGADHGRFLTTASRVPGGVEGRRRNHPTVTDGLPALSR
jgi:flagellar hook-associated protein 3 FlgL